MSPSLNSEHHFILQFPAVWVRKAKEIRRAEDDIPGKNKVYSATRWAGKLGEWGFYTLYRNMRPVTSKFKAEDKDFISDLTGIRYDTKLKCASGAFSDHYHADLNRGQYLKGKNNVDVYVFVFHTLDTCYLRFCGWLYRKHVKSRGELWKKGKTFKGYPVKDSKYTLYYKDLNSMHLLGEVLKEQMPKSA